MVVLKRKGQVLLPSQELETLPQQQQELEEDFEDDLFNDNLDMGTDIGIDDFGMGNGGEIALQKHQDLLKELTNFDQYHKELLNGWLGLIWNSKHEQFESSSQIKPIMNMYGAVYCLSRLKTYTRKNNILTHINEDQYNHIIGDFVEELWMNLSTRAEEFDIEHDGDILRVANEMEHAAQLILMGAGDGKYNEVLTKTTHRSESMNVNDIQRMYPGGFMPGPTPMMPKKRGLIRKAWNEFKGG